MQLNDIKSIECFGIPGSGKTYIRNEIKKILKRSNLKILDRRELIITEYKSVIELNFLEKQAINYFKLLNFIKDKNIKNNTQKVLIDNNKDKNYSINLLKNTQLYLKNKYEAICKRILLKDVETKKLYRFISKILRESKDVRKKQYHFWFVEILAAISIFKKIKNKRNFIYFPDEGLIQRTFLLKRLIQPKNINIIKEYLKIIPKAELIFNITSKNEKIQKVHNLRKLTVNNFQLNKIEIDKIIDFKKKFIRDYVNFNFKTIENNSRLKKTLKNYFKN